MSPESLSARLRQLVVRERFAPDEATPVLEAATELDACIEALQNLVTAYAEHIEDRWEGFVDPEQESEVIAARAVLARLSPSTDKGAAPTPKGGTRE